MVVEGFFGESYERPFTRTSEFLRALTPLLHGEPVDIKGDQVRASGWLTIHADPCPVLLAALGPRMLELAGRSAAGTTVGSCGPRTIATHVAPIINEAAANAERPKPRIMALVTVVVTDDPGAVRAAGAEQGRLYDELPSYRGALDREGVASGADLILAGSIERIVEGLAEYVDAGVTELRVSIGASTERDIQATRAALTELLSG
jgi:alkanesulfonate monooxygenase SsuD/methylene tetrahydromethanopterin reductase-like flavin-dependent oxidoreductase (luciferase family)